MEGPPILLEPDIAQAIAIVLHELATNAAKYGAWSAPGGRVRLSWVHESGQLSMRWREVDGPPTQAPKRRGFGSRIIAQFVGQFGGQVEFQWAEEGLVCQFDLRV